MRILSVLVALILGASSAVADQSVAFCAAAKNPLQADPRLAVAVAAAFDKATFKATADDRVYPLKVLHYATADVLIVQAGEPGKACHGCGAPLSAYVLRRLHGSLKLVRVYRKFATPGTFGAVQNFSPIEIGGDDGMAIKVEGRSRATPLQPSTSSPFTRASSSASIGRQSPSPTITRARSSIRAKRSR
jgi:hypothetical protein